MSHAKEGNSIDKRAQLRMEELLAYEVSSRILARWEPVRYLDSGTFSHIFLVRNRRTGTKAVLKFIPNPMDLLACREEESQEDLFYQTRFAAAKREAEIMGRFRGEAHVVQFLEEPEYLKLSFVNAQGETVRQYAVLICMPLFRNHKEWFPLIAGDRNARLRLGIEISEALIAFEEKGVYHRDIKPGNILMDDEGHFCLSDVGEAKLESEFTTTGFHGTRPYMAPEVYNQENERKKMHSDHRSDIYSLGIILYRLFNRGQFPFLQASGELTEDAQTSFKSYSKKYGSEVNDQYLTDGERARLLRYDGAKLPMPCEADPQLGKVILRACAYQKEDRYATAAELREDLRCCMDGRGIGTEKKSIGAIVGVCGCLLVAMIAVGAVYFVNRHPTISVPVPTPVVALTVKPSEYILNGDYYIEAYADGTCVILEYKGHDASVSVPETIGGRQVVEIGSQAFSNNKDLERVIIPDSVMRIGSNAFFGCEHLASVGILGKAVDIDENAFNGCEALETISKYSDDYFVKIYADGTCVLEGYCGSAAHIVIPQIIDGNRVVGIGSAAFNAQDNENLVSVVIPDGVTDIDFDAFYGCDKLTAVTIPESVVGIARSHYDVFYECNALQTIRGEYGSEAEIYAHDHGYQFESIASISNSTPIPREYLDFRVRVLEDGSCEITDYTGSQKYLAIPEEIYGHTVVGITDMAFEYSNNLKSVLIPDSVSSIGGGVFRFCHDLLDVSIPNSVKSIESYTFEACENLSSIVIPDGVETIEKDAFLRSGLTSITIPSSVVTIDEDAFSNSELTRIYGIPGSAAEAAAYELGIQFIDISTPVPTHTPTSSPSISPTLTPTTEPTPTPTAAPTAEPYSEPIVSLTPVSEVSEALLSKAIYERVPSDYSYEVKRANGEMYIVITGYDGPPDADLVIPKQIAGLPVKEISDNAFFFRNDLLGELTIPEGVVSIGDNAFSNCWNLRGNLILPQSLVSIGESAFEECRNLTGNLTIPDGVAQIFNWTFWNCSGLTGKLTIPNGVISIGVDAFAGCSGLTGELSIPDSVTEIGPRAFAHCSGLKGDLLLPDRVTYIDQGAFSSCTGLNGTLTIPKSVEYLDSSAFEDCMFLEIHDYSGLFNQNEVRIPEGFSWLDESRLSFEEEITGSELLKISGHKGVISGNVAMMPEYGGRAVSEISSWAFYNCSQLTGIAIPEGVARIGSHAFYKCEKMESIILPTTLTWIGDYAFCNCQKLKEVAIPKSVEHIGTWAFGRCYNLKKIIGVKGSAAEALAKEIHVEFQEME